MLSCEEKLDQIQAAAEEMRQVVDLMAEDPFLRDEVRSLRAQLRQIKALTVHEPAPYKDDHLQNTVSKLVAEIPLPDLYQNKEAMGAFVGELVRQIWSSTDQAEREQRRKRQAEGIAAAKAQGVRFGRTAQTLPENFEQCRQAWRRGEISAEEAAEKCGMEKAVFYRCAARVEKAAPSDGKVPAARKRRRRSQMQERTQETERESPSQYTAHTGQTV